MRRLLLLFAVCAAQAALSQNFHKFQIYFETNTYTLSPAHKLTIDSVIALLKTVPQAYKVDIIGHSDTTGSAAANYMVSLRRGEETGKYFEDMGFSKSAITISGKGFFEPLDDNSTEEGKAVNRRVTISIRINLPKNISIGGIRLKDDRYKINTDTASVIEHPSGTSILVPAGVFVDKNGKPVLGEVEIVYKEYRDPVEFILAGIPLNQMQNGEAYNFNSAGMFRILAYKNGVPVYLRRGKNIHLDFALNKDLYAMSLYRFDTLAQRWTEIAELTDGSGRDRDAFRMYCGGHYIDPTGHYCKMAECETLYYLHTFGTLFAGRVDLIFDALKRKDRYNALPTIQEIHRREQLRQKLYLRLDSVSRKLKEESHSYRITRLSEGRRKLIFNVRCQTRGDNNELEVLRNIDWKFYTRNNPGYAADVDRKWMACQITRAGENYNMVLKDSTRQLVLNDLRIRVNDKVRKKEKDAYLKALFAKYDAVNTTYNTRITELYSVKQKVLDQSASNQDALDSLHRIPYPDGLYDWFYRDSLYCFWQGSREYMSKPELTLYFDDWFRYFDAHKTEMLPRYSAIKKDARYAGCMKREKEREETRNFYQEKKEKKKEKVTKALTLSTLGIYSCNSLVKLNDPVEVIATFKDASGKTIQPLFIYLVDNSINGMVRYDASGAHEAYKFSFSPASENTLVVIDGAGKSYIFRSDQFKSVPVSGRKNTYTFNVEKIRTYKSLDDMKRNLLKPSGK